MAQFSSTTNPLVIQITENTTVRPVFEVVTTDLPPIPPRQWRNCITGTLQNWPPAAGYREVPFTGAGGGTCWEPTTEVGFTPSLANLQFTYRRGTSAFPTPQSFAAQNPSTSLSYRVSLSTNNTYFSITPSEFIIGPRGNVPFSISLNTSRLSEFGDGNTNFDLRVSITQL
jgi:hypothetical protein